MRGDLTRVRQILFNLLSNASKFTERGTITLRAVPEGAGLRFEVQDTGIGMTEEQLGRLFQAFAQAEAATASKYGGTGLGLAISKMFSEMMGGTIAVASTPGAGTTFTVRLPREVREASRADAPIAPAAPGQTGTVLVIDDDPAARDLTRRILAREGYRVVEAPDGETGLRLAREIRPDLITLDILMPGMDGWRVLEALKTDPDLAATPVILQSILEDRNLGFALGAAEYLTKPIDRQQLTALVRRYVARESGAPILVVEDDAPTREVLGQTLTRAGWKVTEAENGHAALRRMAEAPPSLVLLDLMMPEMDGFEFLEALRRNETGPAVPVVVLTAKSLTEDDRRRLNGGVEHIMLKHTMQADTLLAELRRLVPQ
jgi:CheY-like chemotaxis protein